VPDTMVLLGGIHITFVKCRYNWSQQLHLTFLLAPLAGQQPSTQHIPSVVLLCRQRIDLRIMGQAGYWTGRRLAEKCSLAQWYMEEPQVNQRDKQGGNTACQIMICLYKTYIQCFDTALHRHRLPIRSDSSIHASLLIPSWSIR
jgi:hypothetical protein